MTGIDDLKNKFALALQHTRDTGAKLNKSTLNRAVSAAAFDDGVVDAFEKQEIADQWARFKPNQVTQGAREEFAHLTQSLGLPKPSPVTPASWLQKPTPMKTTGTMLLLTDGRMMVQDGASKRFKLLTPDKHGSYANGTWSNAAPMSKPRQYYSSSVLSDGRVLVAGGEYTYKNPKHDEDPTLEIYDPAKNTWSPVPGPGWAHLGDAPSTVLPDGRVMFGSIDDTRTAIFDPKTNTWADGGDKANSSAEESWALLKDGSVLTVDCVADRNQSELWVPGQDGSGKWISGGTLPVTLADDDSEIGPAIGLNDGRVLYAGATGHTALFTPSSVPGQAGSWAAGSNLPKDAAGNQLVAKDAPGVLLTNGHVLLTAGPIGSDGGYGGPTSCIDFNPVSGKMAAIDPADSTDGAPFAGRMLMLPNGEVAFAHGGPDLSFLSMGHSPVRSPAPVITGAPSTATAGTTLTLEGQGFNGVSQDVGYGDDAAAATNYPLARLIAPDGTMTYLKTHDHSTMGIGTGSATVSTQVDLPSTLRPGNYRLQVVTNGVASAPVRLQVAASS